MRRKLSRSKAVILGPILSVAACCPMFGQRSVDSLTENAIPEIAVIVAEFDAFPAKDIREDIDLEKLDMSELLKGDMSGKITASEGLKIKAVKHWNDDVSPFAIEFEGKGSVALDLPRKISTIDGEEKKGLKTHKDVFFVTVTAQPALSTDPDKLTYLFVGGAAIGFGLEPPTRGIRAANMFLLNGDAKKAALSDWFASGISFPVNEDYQVAIPIHLTLRIDPKAGEWDLFFRGQLRYAGIEYGKPIKQIAIRSAGVGPTSLAELAVTSNNPLFEDADFDGIEDSEEVELGFSSEENDRTVLDELGEFTNLQHFLNLRKRYRSRSERELERVLQEAIAVKELGQEPSDELKSLQIPDEMRKLRFKRTSKRIRSTQLRSSRILGESLMTDLSLA